MFNRSHYEGFCFNRVEGLMA